MPLKKMADRIKYETEQEAKSREDADVMIVCGHPSNAIQGLPGFNTIGKCAMCGVEICWHSDAREPSKKVCMQCGFSELGPDEPLVVSHETQQTLVDYLKNKGDKNEPGHKS